MRRLPLVLVLVLACLAAGRVNAQEIVLERFERWELYPAPGAPDEPVQALLLLFVRNESDRLIKRWQALLVVRDSAESELFRLAIERDSADLGPGSRARMELTFRDRAHTADDPYDHLLGNDTMNLHLAFDEVRVVESGEVAYVPAGVPLCFSEAAWTAAARARRVSAAAQWREASDAAGCQWTQEPLTVEYVRPYGPDGAVVRPRLMTGMAWVFAQDVARQ
jgi:hypothetical protein